MRRIGGTSKRNCRDSPYKVGDAIKVAGAEGVVKEIQVFSTILHSADNKRIIIPNGKITSNTIVNNTL